jgi:hypothetical protein
MARSRRIFLSYRRHDTAGAAAVLHRQALRSATAIRHRGYEHDRVRIDRRGEIGLLSGLDQCCARRLQVGKGRPSAEASADLQRRRGQEHPDPDQVDPDTPPTGLGSSLLEQGQTRGGGTAGVAHVDEQVREVRLADVETVQPRLAPPQQPPLPWRGRARPALRPPPGLLPSTTARPRQAQAGNERSSRPPG